MLYTRRTFTCPAASGNVSNKNWDRAFLSADEFIAKYGESPDGQVEFVNLGPVDAKVEFHTSSVPATLPPHCGSTLVVTDGTSNP